MIVPYFRASIGPDEMAGAQAVLASGWLTTGEVTRNFERECAAYLGLPHTVAVNSCTAALHLALEALGVGRGDFVLVPTMTFAATAEVVRYMDAVPVLVDCDPVTLCVDPHALLRAAETWSTRGNLRAILPMHYGGQMADMDAIHSIARKFDTAILEDAAHTFPAYTRSSTGQTWQAVGASSQAACFSFYANKCITTGEGGLFATADPQLAERVRIMSLHGLSKSAWNRFDTRGSWYYEILAPGFKYNLTDVAAAIGRAQLQKADALWQGRRRVAAWYKEGLAPWREFLETPTELPDRQSSWHLFPVRLHRDRLSIDRAAVIDALKDQGVTCSVHWMPLHLHPYYRETYGYAPEHFPVATAEWQRLISLPIFPSMSQDEVEYVCQSIGGILARHAGVPKAVTR